MPMRSLIRASSNPLGVVLRILAAVFLVEGAVMFLLPVLGPWPRPSLAEAVTDASLLSLGVSPTMWFLVVRPLRAAHRQRGEVLRLVLETQESERRRLGSDLHDELGQSLTALTVGLRGLAMAAPDGPTRGRAEELVAIASSTLEHTRTLARGIRSDVLVDFGLAVALGRLVEDFRAAHGLAVTCDVELPSEARLPPLVESAAYRIAQEAMTNVARHAVAGSMRVSASLAGDRSPVLTLTVSDDGRGLTPGKDANASLGLRSMRERAELLGGTLMVRDHGPSGGSGTTVEARIPIGHADPGEPA